MPISRDVVVYFFRDLPRQTRGFVPIFGFWAGEERMRIISVLMETKLRLNGDKMETEWRENGDKMEMKWKQNGGKKGTTI